MRIETRVMNRDGTLHPCEELDRTSKDCQSQTGLDFQLAACLSKVTTVSYPLVSTHIHGLSEELPRVDIEKRSSFNLCVRKLYLSLKRSRESLANASSLICLREL